MLNRSCHRMGGGTIDPWPISGKPVKVTAASKQRGNIIRRTVDKALRDWLNMLVLYYGGVTCRTISVVLLHRRWADRSTREKQGARTTATPRDIGPRMYSCAATFTYRRGERTWCEV